MFTTRQRTHKIGLIAGVVASLLITTSASADDDCAEWLSGSGAKPGQPSCDLKCSTHPSEMQNFYCNTRCEEFCKLPPPPCKVSPFWSNVLNGDPKPFQKSTADKVIRIAKAISRLPLGFEPKSLKAVVTTSSIGLLAPSNPAASYPDRIVLFPKAFSSAQPLERILLHEVVHQLTNSEWSGSLKSFEKAIGWDRPDGASRPGQFIEQDGSDSPEEDFANSVEYFVFEAGKLESTSPAIYNWIKKNLGSKLKLQKGCT